MPQHEALAQDAVERGVEHQRHQQHPAQRRQHQHHSMRVKRFVRVGGDELRLLQRHPMGRLVESDDDLADRRAGPGQRRADIAAPARGLQLVGREAGRSGRTIGEDDEDLDILQGRPARFQVRRWLRPRRHLETNEDPFRSDRVACLAARPARRRGGHGGKHVGARAVGEAPAARSAGICNAWKCDD
jgi:hypothetical protein